MRWDVLQCARVPHGGVTRAGWKDSHRNSWQAYRS